MNKIEYNIRKVIKILKTYKFVFVYYLQAVEDPDYYFSVYDSERIPDKDNEGYCYINFNGGWLRGRKQGTGFRDRMEAKAIQTQIGEIRGMTMRVVMRVEGIKRVLQ